MTPPRFRSYRWAWLALLVAVPLLTTAILVGSLIGGGSPPTNVAVAAPPGYVAVTDPYFGYAVPKAWRLDPVYSDSVGDSFYGDPAAWVGESLVVRSTAPEPGQPPPAATTAFGVPAPQPYEQSGATPMQIPGASVAYLYQLSRPGGFTAVAVDAWLRSSGTEMWLIVHASPAITVSVVASVKGGEPPAKA